MKLVVERNREYSQKPELLPSVLEGHCQRMCPAAIVEPAATLVAGTAALPTSTPHWVAAFGKNAGRSHCLYFRPVNLAELEVGLPVDRK